MKTKKFAVLIVVIQLWLALPIVEAEQQARTTDEKCFWGHFDSLDKYHEVQGPPVALIELRGSAVYVYEKCRGS